jgi:hypothetical protein
MGPITAIGPSPDAATLAVAGDAANGVAQLVVVVGIIGGAAVLLAIAVVVWQVAILAIRSKGKRVA